VYPNTISDLTAHIQQAWATEILVFSTICHFSLLDHLVLGKMLQLLQVLADAAKPVDEAM
jgi:hypothetical protein